MTPMNLKYSSFNGRGNTNINDEFRDILTQPTNKITNIINKLNYLEE